MAGQTAAHAGASSDASADVFSKPSSPVMSTRTPPRKGSAAIQPSYGPSLSPTARDMTVRRLYSAQPQRATAGNHPRSVSVDASAEDGLRLALDRQVTAGVAHRPQEPEGTGTFSHREWLGGSAYRSEERRVGEEGRSRLTPH